MYLIKSIFITEVCNATFYVIFHVCSSVFVFILEKKVKCLNDGTRYTSSSQYEYRACKIKRDCEKKSRHQTCFGFYDIICCH